MATATQATVDRPSEERPQKRDFRQEVTDNIVQMLEKGVAPWQKPWEARGNSLGMPMNPTTGKAYRGGNAIHLIATALRRGYDDSRWMTYKQAAENGWQVRKGEKGTQIEFWEAKQAEAKSSAPTSREGEDGSEKPERQEDRRLIHRVYTVFNAKQIEGVPAHQPRQHSAFEAVRAGEQILQNSGASIAHDQADRAFYSRGGDSIHLPPKDSFKEASGYYGTALHELAHWSGHPSRLNRSTLTESYRFGDVNYAKEELRAELASVFLAAERGIPHDPEQHAAYVGSWIKSLKEDKNEIFRAAHDASAAADFLLGLERDRSIAEESLQGESVVDLDAGSSATVSELERETAKLDRDREQLGETAPNRSATTQDTRQPNGAPTKGDRSLADERALAIAALGNNARTYLAQVESGTYRGQVLGETSEHIVQQVSSRSTIAHPKESLSRLLTPGETVVINYSSGKGSVRDFRQRTRDRELSR